MSETNWRFDKFELLEGEELKIIEGYNKRYAITNKSRVINLEKGIVLKTRIDNVGYIAVRLCMDKKYTQKRLHRLVAEYFIPNPNNLPFVNHIDGNKQNPSIDNLEWVTPKENGEHASRTNLVRKGSKHVQATITDDIAQAILNDSRNGLSPSQLSKKYNVSKSIAQKISDRTRWKHLLQNSNVQRLSKAQVKLEASRVQPKRLRSRCRVII